MPILAFSLLADAPEFPTTCSQGGLYIFLDVRRFAQHPTTPMDDIQLAGDISWMPSNFISGVTTMPVSFTKTA